MSRIVLRLLLAGALLAIAGPVLALGLGRIEVRSQQGQPLLAEIPVVSSDPAELRELQARLASPETFARIGLEPPRGLVSDLQFSVALDPQGRPVIRVTSATPVDQESLTFLVEVDWGQGRLVREYSALIAVPDTLAAPAQPSIQAPVAAPPPTIVRAPEATGTTPETAATPSPVADAGAGAAGQTAPVAPVARPAQAQPAVAPGELPPVQAGQTLSGIAAPLAREAGISVNQAMVLLLRTNPEAFIGGNLNLVREGAVLRVPPRDEWTRFNAAEANAVVREQVGQWREMRRPAPQPQLAAASGEDTAAGPATPVAQPPSGAQARLEITPPSGEGQRAGTQSGIDAGGGGDMLRQELQQANESLAARNAEIDELKARLTDLETLQQQQQQLIALKDAELAAAQQRMEASNQAGGSVPWLWLGLALLLVGALAFVLGRRGLAVTHPRPARPGRPTWHAGSGAGASAATASTPSPVAPTAAPEREPEPVSGPASVASHASPAPVVMAEPEAAFADAPADAAGPADDAVADTADAAAANTDAGGGGEPVELPAGVERLELARAYLDLGDTQTARSLLREVAAGSDPAASAEAAQLLRSLD